MYGLIAELAFLETLAHLPIGNLAPAVELLPCARASSSAALTRFPPRFDLPPRNFKLKIDEAVPAFFKSSEEYCLHDFEERTNLKSHFPAEPFGSMRRTFRLSAAFTLLDTDLLFTSSNLPVKKSAAP